MSVPLTVSRTIYPLPGDVRNRALNDLLFAAYNRPVYAAVFGDSQEAGSVWQAAMNAEFRRIYGDSPGSTFMPLNESGWESGRLWCQGLTADYSAGAQIGGPQGTSSQTTSSFVASGLWTTTDDVLNGWWVRASIGGSFEYRQVSDYVGSTKTVTVSPAFSGTIPSSVVISPVDPRRVPPNIYGRAANATNACRFLCRPDNAFGLDKFGASRLDSTRAQQVLRLPNVPASLSASDTINLRVVYQQTASAPGATVTAKPHNSPLYSLFISTTTTATTLAAELQGSGFVSKTYALAYSANNPYMQAQVGSTANAVTNPLVVVGARYEVPGSHGILLDSFSAGGYSVANLLANHANMADFFAAMPTYEIAMIHLGINDAYSQGKTAVTFKAELQQLIARVKTATGCTVVLLINDVMNIDGTSGQDAEFAQYGQKMRELCDENDNVYMRDMRQAFAETSFNSVAEDEIVLRGRWFSSVSYAIGDIVINGHTNNTDGVGDYQFYQCVSAHSNQRPPNATYWRAMLWKPGINYTAGQFCYLQFPTEGWGGFFKASTTHLSNAASNSPFSPYPEWVPVRQYLNDQVHLSPDGMTRSAALEVKLIMATLIKPVDGTENILAMLEDIAAGETVLKANVVQVDDDAVSGLWYLNQRIQDADAQGLAFMGFTYNGTSSLNVNVTKVNGVADAANGIEQVASAYLLNGRINANVTAVAGVVNAATGMETLASQYFSLGRLRTDDRDGNRVATGNASGQVTLADGSLTTAKLGTFTLAKGTNITGFNDLNAAGVSAAVDAQFATVNTNVFTVLDAMAALSTPINFMATRVQTALPNTAPGAVGGLARTQDVDVTVNVPAVEVTPVLIATPVVSQLESAGKAVRVGPVRPVDYQMFQHTAAALVINPVDAAGEPIDLTGKTLRFLVHDNNGVVKFTRELADGVVWTEGTVTVPITAANLASKADWQWKLRDVTSAAVLGYGRFEILLAPLEAPAP